MSEKSENSNEPVQKTVSCFYERFEKVKHELDNCLDKCKEKVDEKINRLKLNIFDKDSLGEKNQQKGAIEWKVSELRKKIKTIKEYKSKKRALVKAEKAEKRAEMCRRAASLAIVEAELACVEAAKARQKTEENSQKQEMC